MQPFTVILGIILGSLVAIGFGLTVVLFLFWLLQGDYPRVASELPELARSTAIFSILAGLAAAGFLGTLKRRLWRYLALGLLWIGLGATGWYYWPD
jgi:hypothetical protein